MNTKTFALLCLVAGADALSAAVPGQAVQPTTVAPPVAPVDPGPAVQAVQQAAVAQNPTVQAVAYKIPKGKLAENGGTMLKDRYHQVGPDDAYGKKMPHATGPRVSYARLSPNSINSTPIGPTQAYSY